MPPVNLGACKINQFSLGLDEHVNLYAVPVSIPHYAFGLIVPIFLKCEAKKSPVLNPTFVPHLREGHRNDFAHGLSDSMKTKVVA